MIHAASLRLTVKIKQTVHFDKYRETYSLSIYSEVPQIFDILNYKVSEGNVYNKVQYKQKCLVLSGSASDQDESSPVLPAGKTQTEDRPIFPTRDFGLAP